MYEATPESLSVDPLAVAVKPPAVPPWKKTVEPEPGQYAEPLSEPNVNVVGAVGPVVSTITVVVTELLWLPTLSVPRRVSR